MTDIFGGVDYDRFREKFTEIDIPLSSMLRLRVYEQGFEDGTSDLTAVNCTQTVQTTEVFTGSYSLEVTILAGETGYVETPMRPVSPNQRVTFSYAHKEDANIDSIKLIVVWYRENLHVIDEEEFDLTPSDMWVVDSRTVVAPTSTAYASLRLVATAGSGSPGHVYADSIFIDLVGQILRTDGAGNIKTVDTDAIDVLTDIRNNITTVIPRPTGNAKARNKVSVGTGSYTTVCEYVVPAGKTFHPAKIAASAKEDIWVRLLFNGSPISIEYFVAGGVPFTDWFPFDWNPCVGDGIKTVELQAMADITSTDVSGEIVGEVVT